MMADSNQDQIELVTEELEDLDRQVEAGDLDVATAEVLRAKYLGELDTLVAERTDSQSLPSDGATRSRGGGRGRAVVGTAIVAVAIAVIAVFAVNSLTGASTDGAEGIAGDVITGEGAIELSGISNEEMEAVVADNPNVVGMRLALARRYFEGGDFDKALDHYMVVLDAEQHPEALANVGWMTYLSGRPDIALGYVEAALDRQPGMLTALWFLGNIQSALGDFDAATKALVVIVAAEDIPDEVRESARALLLQMEEG
jgi:tetratricopeptide (TPR) repeat protein